jgi:hypothetical protein
MIAIMQGIVIIYLGNSLYKESLFSLIKKKISYYATEYPIRIADRFNHVNYLLNKGL